MIFVFGYRSEDHKGQLSHMALCLQLVGPGFAVQEFSGYGSRNES